MKIIVYRKFQESDLYELTLVHSIYSTKHDFEQNEELRKFSNAVDYEYPFEVIEGTELEFRVLKQFLWLAFDVFNADDIEEGKIVVKREGEVISYKDAAKICHNEIKELQDTIESLQWNLDLYDEIYHDKYGCHITEEFEN